MLLVFINQEATLAIQVSFFGLWCSCALDSADFLNFSWTVTINFESTEISFSIRMLIVGKLFFNVAVTLQIESQEFRSLSLQKQKKWFSSDYAKVLNESRFSIRRKDRLIKKIHYFSKKIHFRRKESKSEKLLKSRTRIVT